MAHVAREPASVRTLTLIGPAGLAAGPPALIRRSGGGALTSLLGRNLGRRGLLAHLAHNVQDPRQAASLVEMVSDAYRYEGSMYSLFSTLIDFPLADRRSLYLEMTRHGVDTLLLWGEHDEVTRSRISLKRARCSERTQQAR